MKPAKLFAISLPTLGVAGTIIFEALVNDPKKEFEALARGRRH
jgi:hypothetical protein